MKTMRQTSRKRFPNWLRELVDSGEVSGVYWLDNEKTTFRVPWTRVDSPDFNLLRDALLFQKWAEFTGRYRVGERTDPSVWKTRFRCAIRKMPEIEELKMENNLDDTNGQQPFRVFRFKKEEVSHPIRKKDKCSGSRGMVKRRRSTTSRNIKKRVNSNSIQKPLPVFTPLPPEANYFPNNDMGHTNNATIVTPPAANIPMYRSDDVTAIETPVDTPWFKQEEIDLSNKIYAGFGSDPLPGTSSILPTLSAQEIEKVLLACSSMQAPFDGALTGAYSMQAPFDGDSGRKFNQSNQMFEGQRLQETKAYNNSLDFFQQSIQIQLLERAGLANTNGQDALKIQYTQDCMLQSLGSEHPRDAVY